MNGSPIATSRTLAFVCLAGGLLTGTGILLIVLGAPASGWVTGVVGIVAIPAVGLVARGRRSRSGPSAAGNEDMEEDRRASLRSISWYLLYPLVWAILRTLFVVSRDGYWTTTLMLYVVVFVVAVLIAVRRGKSLSPKALFERMVQF